MRTMKNIILVVFALSITLQRVVAMNCLSLEEASKKGWIKLSIKSKGGFIGQTIEMKIKNSCNQLLEFKLEAGRRLDSKNENLQDMLVTKPEEFALYPNQLKTICVYGMCCQAHKGCPLKDGDYTIGKMADSNLIKLAEFINKNKYYILFAAQQAVWTVSDKNSIGGISGGDKTEVDGLQKYVSQLTGRPIPKYIVDYAIESDREVMGRAKKIKGIFDYSLPANAHVTVAIYNSNGVLVQLLFKDMAHGKGDYKLYYTFRTARLEQGTYYARLNLDGRTEKEMKIEF